MDARFCACPRRVLGSGGAGCMVPRVLRGRESPASLRGADLGPAEFEPPPGALTRNEFERMRAQPRAEAPLKASGGGTSSGVGACKPLQPPGGHADIRGVSLDQNDDPASIIIEREKRLIDFVTCSRNR